MEYWPITPLRATIFDSEKVFNVFTILTTAFPAPPVFEVVRLIIFVFVFNTIWVLKYIQFDSAEIILD